MMQASDIAGKIQKTVNIEQTLKYNKQLTTVQWQVNELTTTREKKQWRSYVIL